jgi:two-component system, NtrC family, response regulator HydG
MTGRQGGGCQDQTVEQQGTLDEQDSGPLRSTMAGEALALVICWCADASWRTGEIAWLPQGHLGEARLLGRGGSLPDDPHPRLIFLQQRPNGSESTPPLSLPTLSRVQCVVWSLGLERLMIRNVGRSPMIVDQRPIDETMLAPGRTVQLGQQLLLLCVRRAVSLARPPDGYAVGAFGAPDGLGIVGESPAIWRLRQQLGLIGPRSGHVLLLGASGTGKELSAQAIHALSDRRSKPLIARNAATIPESLVDAELFGNAKNYPNPGMVERPGLVGEADRSTLFLDEIAELAPAVQAHLLRLLDGGEYHRLGESLARRSNLRMIAATNDHISKLKDDFLARFTYRIEVPDLNSRREDIPMLAAHLIRRAAAADPELAGPLGDASRALPPLSIGLCRRLLERKYTSHLRELDRALLEAFVQADRNEIEESLSPRQDPGVLNQQESPPPLCSTSVASGPLAPARIQATLDEHNGRLESAYRALGLKNRFALTRLIAKHGLEVRRRPERNAPRHLIKRS